MKDIQLDEAEVAELKSSLDTLIKKVDWVIGSGKDTDKLKPRLAILKSIRNKFE